MCDSRPSVLRSVTHTHSHKCHIQFQVLLARHKESTKYYAVKVLQKKIIMKKKEVRFD